MLKNIYNDSLNIRMAKENTTIIHHFIAWRRQFLGPFQFIPAWRGLKYDNYAKKKKMSEIAQLWTGCIKQQTKKNTPEVVACMLPFI